ncbi:MAG: helix-turn-helix domain-containing protein [Promethearchaeota archaeon]
MDQLTEKKIEIKIKNFNSNISYKILRDSIEIIGNKDRFLILNLLHYKSCLLSDIEKNLNRNQPSISHHVRILEDHGFIHSSKKGKFKEYSISKEKFVNLLRIWNQWFKVIRFKDY